MDKRTKVTNTDNKNSPDDAREQLALLYDEFGARIYSYVLSLVSKTDDASEIVQEVFTKVFVKMSRGHSIDDPVGYLFRTARNEAFTHLRRFRVRLQAFKKLKECNVLLEVSTSGGTSDEGETVEKTLRKLPVKQREVVVLKFYEGMTFEEIGRILGISQNTAASRYRYALAKMKKYLIAEEDRYGKEQESTETCG